MDISFNEAMELYNKYPMFKYVQESDIHLFSYHYVNPEVYDTAPEGKELRGIIFDSDGNIIARPFPKFFNFAEPHCKVTKDDIITTNEKIDGSMIIGFVHGQTPRLASRGQLDSYHVRRAHEIAEGKHYKLIRDCHQEGITPIFEMIDIQDPNVLRYTDNDLFLVGMRRIEDGKLLDPYNLRKVAKTYNISYPPIKHDYRNVWGVVEDVKGKEDYEGVVGYRMTANRDIDIVKIKTDWYFSVHKIITEFSDGLVKKLFLNGEIDDVYQLLPDDIKQEVNRIMSETEDEISAIKEEVNGFFENNEFETRKELGYYVMGNIDKPKQRIYFKAYEGKDITDEIMNYLLKKYKN